MVAYVILQIEVTDSEKHAKYRQIATPIVERYGGKYLARGGKMLPRGYRRFPSVERYKSFHNAPEYQEAKALRRSATRGNMLVIEGV